MTKVSYNPRTARTLYNEKDVLGVKHDTEKHAEESRIVVKMQIIHFTREK